MCEETAWRDDISGSDGWRHGAAVMKAEMTADGVARGMPPPLNNINILAALYIINIAFNRL